MNSNKVKFIACASMLIDHIGYLLFTQITVLRYIGRLAMPIFAFFIAEGCRHTKNKLRYFGGIMLLAVLCEAVYLGNSYFNGGIHSVFLNVLFTLSLSIPLCCFFLKLDSSKKGYAVLFMLYFAFILVFLWCLDNSVKIFATQISLDYGIAGILLCFMPMLCKDRLKKLASFSVGVVVYCLLMQEKMPYIWYSLLSIPLIALYNGKRGSKSFKYAFYLFYPLHLVAIYAVSYFLN